MNKQTKFIIDMIKKNNCKSILNIGYRQDSDKSIQNFCLQNSIEWNVLEIFKENCDYLKSKNICSNVFNEDARNIKKINKIFDGIIWLHGPEHVLWKDFILFKQDIEDCSNKLTIYQAPEGFYDQGCIYSNPYEKHVETLYEKMFSDLGYKTNNFCEFGEKTFSAWIEK